MFSRAPILVFAVFFIGLFLFLGLTAITDPSTQANIQQAQASPQIQSTITCSPYVIFIILGIVFVTWMMRPFIGGGSTYTGHSTPTPEQLLDIVVRGNMPEWNAEDERDTFSNDEILQPGIDIRLKEHREHIKAQRRERRREGITREQQVFRAKWEGREEPDLSGQPLSGRKKEHKKQAPPKIGYKRREFTFDEYLKMLKKLFKHAIIRTSPNLNGGVDILFNMRGRNPLEMSVSDNRGGKYRIVQTIGYRRYRELYNGEAEGAILVIVNWYQGGIPGEGRR